MHTIFIYIYRLLLKENRVSTTFKFLLSISLCFFWLTILSFDAMSDDFFTNKQFLKEDSLSIDECIELALTNNPLIISSHFDYQASLARVNIASAIPQPGILLDYPLQPSIFSPHRSQEKFFGVNQTIEFPGRRYLRSRRATLEAEETFWEKESLRIELIFQVKEAFYNLLLREEQLKYARENHDLSKQFSELVKLRYENGEVSKAEFLRAEVELAKAINLIKEFENELQIAMAKLNVLLGRNRNVLTKIRGGLKQSFAEYSIDEAIQKALQNRPEIKKVESSLVKSGVEKKLAYLYYFPDFNLGLARHIVEEEKYWALSLSFSVPLFFWQIKKGEIAEIESILKARQSELKYYRDIVSLEVEEAFSRVMLNQEEIRRFEKDILPQSEQVYQMFLFSFREGEIGGLDLIEARRTWLDARISYAESLYQHAVSLAFLEKAMGTVKGGK